MKPYATTRPMKTPTLTLTAGGLCNIQCLPPVPYCHETLVMHSHCIVSSYKSQYLKRVRQLPDRLMTELTGPANLCCRSHPLPSVPCYHRVREGYRGGTLGFLPRKKADAICQQALEKPWARGWTDWLRQLLPQTLTRARRAWYAPPRRRGPVRTRVRRDRRSTAGGALCGDRAFL